MKSIIKIKQIEKCNNKIFLVKLVKECSGLGLKESKFICDDLETGQTKQFDAKDSNFVKKFRDEIWQAGGKYLISGGVDFVREFKMLELGLGENSDYINFITEHFEVVQDKSKFLESVLKNLSREQIVNLFENVKSDYDGYMC